jgi:hypothetical protein
VNTGMPGYWQNEQSGVLAPVVRAYLNGVPLSMMQIKIMRAYLRQWIAGDFRGPGIESLRRRVETISTNGDLKAWLDDALELGIDPL